MRDAQTVAKEWFERVKPAHRQGTPQWEQSIEWLATLIERERKEAVEAAKPTNAPEMVNQINDTLLALRRIKEQNPGLRLGYSTAPGSILNAYREGDISFEACISEFDARERRAKMEALEWAKRQYHGSDPLECYANMYDAIEAEIERLKGQP